MREKTYQTTLTKVNDTYFPMIERQLTGNNINMDNYAKQCVMNAIASINNALEVAGVDWNHPQLDRSNITQTLLNVASLKLNSSANPNEVYFQVRNVKLKQKDESGKDVDVWKKQIEMGVEGDGNDAILSRFGRDVEQVMQYWVVRENDDFQYPSYVGLEMEPPRWTPKGTGKVVKIVYPIIKRNRIVEYHIAEREDVIKNLIAHIKNNLMNETFGIAKSRFKATYDQKKQIDQKKEEIINRVRDLGLDRALQDDDIKKHVSPAWKDEQSKEAMIIRKMRNNIVKKIPKDFGHPLVEISYQETTSDYKQVAENTSNEHANGEVIDIEQEENEPTEEPEKEVVEEQPKENKEPEKKEKPLEEYMEEQDKEKAPNEEPPF